MATVTAVVNNNTNNNGQRPAPSINKAIPGQQRRFNFATAEPTQPIGSINQ
jgi:hypothetical protein